MGASPLDTLFLPLETSVVLPDGAALFIGAESHPYLRALKADIWQPFKPLADRLTGHTLLADLPENGTYALALVNIPKQVEEAKHWIASALKSLQPEGWLVIAAANDANGSRLEKWMKELAIPYESESKNKARVVWAKRPAVLPSLLTDWHVRGEKQKVQTGDGYHFISQPGVFGWDKIDVGSKLLTGLLPPDLKGIGADFGAGTGYLSRAILESAQGVKILWLAEADKRALECAKKNLENVRADILLEYLWADLTRPAALPPLDFIVMNPPFHTGKKTDTSLGQAFIKTAAHHLKKGGRLYMVANAHLPYEQLLRDNFAQVRPVTEEKGFKIFEAVK